MRRDNRVSVRISIFYPDLVINYLAQNLSFPHSSNIHHSRKPIFIPSHTLSRHFYIHTLARHSHCLPSPVVSTSPCTRLLIAQWRLCVCALTGGVLLAAQALGTGLLCPVGLWESSRGRCSLLWVHMRAGVRTTVIYSYGRTDAYAKLRSRAWLKRSRSSHERFYPRSWWLRSSYHSFHYLKTTYSGMGAKLLSRCWLHLCFCS
jgi:hypothetical protein